jgi:hypothetical protein
MSHELAVRALGVAPCDGCARAARCAAERLACSAFVAFVEGRSGARWAVLPRTDASRARFDAVLLRKAG